MNKTFKSIWNESSGTYVAASEETTAGGRKTSSTRAGRRMPRRGGSQRLVLEPRIVFDGAMPVVAADAVIETKTADTASDDSSAIAPAKTNTPSESTLPPAEGAQQERELIDGTFALAGQNSKEIIFIDSAVEGLEAFLLDHPQADVVLLDPGKDGMEQIAATLEGRTDIETIHILSHGSSGELNLGNDTFNLESMNGEHADELATIKSALSEEADILIYGCNVAANESGKAFIAALSAATGADIAASTDLTGSADFGGDWDLEHTSGDIESSSALDRDLIDGYSGLLAVINVNQTNDVVNGDTSSIANLLAPGGDGGDGISLREAIEAANNTAGADTIILQADTYTLALGALNINTDITITGAGVDQTFIDGDSLNRVLSIQSGTVSISDLTIQNGGGVANGAGIGIRAGAEVNINDVKFIGNAATVEGGAIHNSGSLSLTDVTLENNSAGNSGGAITNLGRLTITNATLDNNSAVDDGGGIRNAGNLLINGATFSNNTAGGDGGAILAQGNSFDATNVTISGNSAGSGGGIRYESDSITSTLQNVTITNNSSTIGAGGVEVLAGKVLRMGNTIIAGNFSPTPSEVDLKGKIDSLGTNLIGVSAGGSGYIASDILDVAPTLGALADNGGPTFTHALLIGSRGINEGSNTGAPSTDQRGAIRDAVFDIGAYETVNAPVNTVPGAQSVNEDTSLLIPGISVSDADGNLATTQLTVGNGTLNVDLSGGATISSGANGSNTLTLSGTQAQINAALGTVTYQGTLNFNGVDTLTMVSTDSSGTPLSDTDAVTINVGAVNDAPVNTVPGAQSVNEDTSLAITGISVNDVDGNLATTRLTVGNGTLNVNLAGGATISSGANGSNTLTLSGTQVQINSALGTLIYQGTLSFSGVDTLTVLSTDSGGTPLSDTDAVTITVNAVNDIPVNTVPGAQSVNEDTSLIISGISVNDVDNNLATTQLTVGNGTLNVNLAGGATISSGANGSNTLTLSGTQAQINAALGTLTYQGTLNFSGVDTLTVLSTDSGGTPLSDTDTVTINVNDAPVNTVPGAQSVAADTASAIAGISVNDANGNLATTQLTVGNGTLNVDLSGGATISSGANGSNTLTLSGTQAQINAALGTVIYQGSLAFNGTDTLTMLSTDSAGVPLSDTDSVSIFVGSFDPIIDLNSGPTVTVTGPVVTTTTTTTDLVTLGNFGTNTGNTPPAPWVESGQKNLGRVIGSDERWQWRAGSTTGNTITQALTVPANTSNTTVVTTSTETSTTDESTTVVTTNAINSITFDMAWSNADTNGANDNQLIISYGGVTYATFETFEGGIKNAPGLPGIWTYFNGASGPATTLSVSNEVNDALTPITINIPGVTASGSISFFYTDGSTGSGSDDLTIDNVAVNSTTTTTTSVTTTTTTSDTTDNDWTTTFIENGAAVPIADTDSSIYDSDSANMSSAAITLTNQTTGDRLLVNGSSAASGTLASGITWTRTDTSVTLSGIFTKAQYADAIKLVQFENTTENPSTTPRVINTTVNDGTVDSNVAVTTINVIAVDDAPVNNVPGAQAATEDVTHSISGISVTDYDVGGATEVASTVLSVSSGTLNVTAAGGAVVTNNGTNSVTITGNAAAINATLAGNVDYLGNLNFNGADTLTVVTTDIAGVPLPLSVSATVTITVNPIVTFTPPTPPIEDRLFLEPEWFLNKDSILNTDKANEAIYRWQTVNDPRTPISSAIRENYNNVDHRLNVQSNSESVAPTHVQNAVRGMELEPSATSTIQQAVTASQKESISNDIRVNSVRNNINPSESNIMDVSEDNKGSVEPSLQKATEDGHDKSSIRDSVTTEEKGSKDDAQGEKLKPVKDTLEVNERNILDLKPVNDQIQDNKINLKTNPENKKAAKSFSDQLQHMAKNARTSSNGVPGNK